MTEIRTLEVADVVLCCNQNQNIVLKLERDLSTNEREREKVLTEKGRLEQEAEVGF